jgi:hypothetical protein
VVGGDLLLEGRPPAVLGSAVGAHIRPVGEFTCVESARVHVMFGPSTTRCVVLSGVS